MTAQLASRTFTPAGVTIKLASMSDELLQCHALRAAVFKGEQQCLHREECDGNDCSAGHLMLYVDGEPAVSMRARWFSGFAKLDWQGILEQSTERGASNVHADWSQRHAN